MGLHDLKAFKAINSVNAEIASKAHYIPCELKSRIQQLENDDLFLDEAIMVGCIVLTKFGDIIMNDGMYPIYSYNIKDNEKEKKDWVSHIKDKSWLNEDDLMNFGFIYDAACLIKEDIERKDIRKGLHFICTDTKREKVFEAIDNLIKDGYYISYKAINITEVQFVNRLLYHESGIDFSRIKQGDLSDHELGLLSEAAQKVSGYNLYVSENVDLSKDKESVINGFLEEAKSFDSVNDKCAVFIDYNMNPMTFGVLYNGFAEIKTPIVVVNDLSIND